MVTPGTVQPVDSITNGTVVYVSTQQTAPNSGGNALEIKGTDGLYYYYAHLRDAPIFKSGDTVKTGQQIGIVGSSGNASPSAPHLHIGIGHSISTGVGPSGGLGTGFDAVAMLKDLQARANIPELATADGQAAIAKAPGVGTITIAPPTSPVSSSLTDRIQWLAKLLHAAGVDPSQIATLVAISLAENSSSDPNAVSTTGDYGLFQINWGTWGNALKSIGVGSPGDLKDPVLNAKAAAYVLEHQGLQAWSTYKLGLQNQFIGDVNAALSGVDLGDGTTTTDGGSGDTSATPCDCPKWKLMEAPLIEIPDLGCVFSCQVGQWVDNLKQWWGNWTYNNLYDIGFGIAGAVLLIIGVAILAGGPAEQVAQIAVKSGAIAA